MKILIVFLSLAAFIAYAQTVQHKIIFSVVAKGLNDTEGIFISGNQDALGFWNPGVVALTKTNDSTWAKELWFVRGINLEFKFTKGSWDFEALNDDGSIPGNNYHLVTNDTSLYFNITRWRNKEPRINYGQITGTVKYHLQFKGQGLKPRDIIVWLPPGYDQEEKHYPVLYMHDGQNIFDPATSTFGYDWRADEIADSLINAGVIDKIIIVAINNTIDRGFEYSYSPLGYQYMKFIAEELKPFIDHEYRTLADKGNTATCGASLGGLISLMMVWNYPEVFSKAACISSAFKIDMLNYVDTILAYSGPKKDFKIYIDIGGIGLDADLKPGNDEMISALVAKGYELNKDLIWHVDKNAIHSESSWAQRIWRPLEFFFGKK